MCLCYSSNLIALILVPIDSIYINHVVIDYSSDWSRSRLIIVSIDHDPKDKDVCEEGDIRRIYAHYIHTLIWSTNSKIECVTMAPMHILCKAFIHFSAQQIVAKKQYMRNYNYKNISGAKEGEAGNRLIGGVMPSFLFLSNEENRVARRQESTFSRKSRFPTKVLL